MTQIEIPRSKKKMIFMLIGSFVFVLIGVWIIVAQPTVKNIFFNNLIVKNISGALAIIFFGIIAISIGRKLPQKAAGLIINDDGIFDNSSAIPAGFIYWTEISNISVINIANQKLLMIGIKNPEEFINRQSGIKRQAMKINYNTYGSPISISANMLKITFDDLHSLLLKKLNSDVS